MNDKVIQMPTKERPEKAPFIPVQDQRELAKIGMVASMGTLLITGFMGKEASRLHIGSGLALIGFSYWHYKLYQPKTPST